MSEKENENQHIINALNFYLDRNLETHHAVMLTGEWGCGKTYFIKNIIKYIENLTPYESHEKEWDNCDLHRSHYISLYGIQNLKDLQTQLFAEFYPVKNIRNIVISMLGASASAGASASVPYFDKISLKLSIKPQNIKATFSKAFNRLKEAVIFFDDLERCAIPVADLFGFINQLVEHNGQKVILIANEDKLKENSKTDAAKQDVGKSYAYDEIKEKLVGTTLELQTSASAVLEHFIAEMKKGKAKSCAEQNKPAILDIFNRMKINNYRSLRIALYDFTRLLSEVGKAFPPFINENNENAKEARRQLLILVLVMDMQYRRHDKEKDVDLNGDFRTTIIIKNKPDSNPNVEKISRFLEPSFRQGSSLDGNNSILLYETVAQFLLKGTVDAAITAHYLKSHFLFKNEKDLSLWERLRNAYITLDKLSFAKTLSGIKCALEAHNITKLYDIFKLAEIIFHLNSQAEFESAPFQSSNSSLFYFKEYISYMKEHKLLNTQNINLGFLESELITTQTKPAPEMSELFAHYKKLLDADLETDIESNLLKDIKNGFQNAEEWYKKYYSVRYQGLLPLYILNEIETTNAILNANKGDMRAFGTVIRFFNDFYTDSNNRKLYEYASNETAPNSAIQKQWQWFTGLKAELQNQADKEHPPFKSRIQTIINQIFKA